MRQKIVLFKLAAIGDVTLACRALNDFTSRYHADFDLHWIIDQYLMTLAQSLYSAHEGGPTLVWHGIDAGRLFKGGFSEKAREAIKIAKILSQLRPDHIVLLHRDMRYRMLMSPFSVIAIEMRKIHELEVYQNAFESLAKVLGLSQRKSKPAAVRRRALSHRIGVLVGGAQNQKVTFQEKRWPHLASLIDLILTRTQEKIVLFGGPDDAALAETLLGNNPYPERIDNLVGKTALENLSPALQNLDSLVCIDSGLGHIAASAMTAPNQKIISLFGPTDPGVWMPRPSGSAQVKLLYKAKTCSPCYANNGEFLACRFTGEDFQMCMTDISAEEVFLSLNII